MNSRKYTIELLLFHPNPGFLLKLKGQVPIKVHEVNYYCLILLSQIKQNAQRRSKLIVVFFSHLTSVKGQGISKLISQPWQKKSLFTPKGVKNNFTASFEKISKFKCHH